MNYPAGVFFICKINDWTKDFKGKINKVSDHFGVGNSSLNVAQTPCYKGFA